MGVLDPVARPLAARGLTTHHSGATAVATGTLADVAGFSVLAIEVSGTFVARLTPVGYVESGGTRHVLQTYTAGGQAIPAITAPGQYYAVVTGMEQAGVRIAAYTSGSVTVQSRAMAGGLPPLGGAAAEMSRVVLSAASSTGYSVDGASGADVRDFSSVRLHVTGTFTGLSLWVRGKHTDGSAFTGVPVLSPSGAYGGDLQAGVITRAGWYVVDVTGIDLLQVYVNSIGSGSVTVTQRGSRHPVVVTPWPRIIELGRAVGVTVPSGVNTLVVSDDGFSTPTIVTDGMAMLFCTVRASDSHEYSVLLAQYHRGSHTYGTAHLELETIFESGGGLRGRSQWVEVAGRGALLYIRQDTGTDQSYDVILYGVR